MRSVDTWVELFLSEQEFAPSGGPWPEHVAGWWPSATGPTSSPCATRCRSPTCPAASASSQT